MLQDVIHPTPEQLSLDVSSPINAQMLEFCDSEFFQETMQNNSEVTSSSNCYYEENSPYNNTNLSLPTNDLDNKFNNNNLTTSTTSTTTTPAPNLSNNTNSSNLSSILFDSSQDDLDNDISASIDFSSPAFSLPHLFTHPQFDFTSIHPQLGLPDSHNTTTLSSHYYSSSDQPAVVPQFMVPSLINSVFEDDCFSSVPNSSSYAHLNPSSPSCSYLPPSIPTFMPSAPTNAALSADCSGIFGGGFYMGSGSDQFQPQETDYQGDNGGIYCPTDTLQRAFNPSDLEAFNNDTKQLVVGTTSSPPLNTEFTNLEDSNFKVGKLSVEQRREKIHRYMKKRNERNFSKKIKYACRKTLADSRPRVRGRFAKNDDFGETNRVAFNNHDDDDDGEQVTVKEEEEMVNSADIFAQISGVNSFKCNYSIQSWI